MSRILFRIGISAFSLGQKVMGLPMGSLLNTKLLATINR